MSLSNDYVITGIITDYSVYKLKEYNKITVNIDDQLKGSTEKATVSINTDFDFHNEAKLKVGAKYLMFFRKVEKTDSTYYLLNSCNSFEIEDDIDRMIVERTREIIAINSIALEKKKMRQTIDWSITCINHDATRYHGLRTLSTFGPLYYYDKKKSEYKRIKKFKISKKQRKQLLSYFLEKDELAYNDVFIVELIKRRNKKKILKKMTNQLRLTDLSKDIWYREKNIMASIAKLSGRKDLKDIYDRINDIGLFSRSKEIIVLTEEFISLI